MTKKHFGAAVDCPRYTTCEKCQAAMCVDCLEKISVQVDKLQLDGRVVLLDDVWTALLGRCYHAGASRFAGFRSSPAGGGGGRWTIACPLCVTVELKPPMPRMPMTLPALPYATMPPKLLKHWKGVTRAPLVVENSSAGPVATHSVEVYVYEQLVGDAEAASCFKRMPAIGKYAVFWRPPMPAPEVDGLNLRIIAGKPSDGSPLVLLSAVAFGALKGCLPGHASPTIDTTAQLARLIMDSCSHRVVGHGPSRKNFVHHRPHSLSVALGAQPLDGAEPLKLTAAAEAEQRARRRRSPAAG